LPTGKTESLDGGQLSVFKLKDDQPIQCKQNINMLSSPFRKTHPAWTRISLSALLSAKYFLRRIHHHQQLWQCSRRSRSLRSLNIS